MTRILSILALAAMLLAGCGRGPVVGPKTAVLRIVTEPAGAKVRVDGMDAPKVTPMTLELLDDQHFLDVQLDGYERTWRRVEKSAMNGEVMIRLEPLAAAVQVGSKPSGATVTMDGMALGTTPLFVPRVNVGHHVFAFSMPGFDVREVPFDIADARPRKFLVNLESLLGTVRVLSQPAGARILLDGTFRGVTPEDGVTPLDIVEIAEGEHQVVARKHGFRELSFNFLLRRQESKLVSLPAMAQLPGSLEIVTDPQDARVFIDGDLKEGRTPMIVRDLGVGEVTVRVEKDGFEAQERRVSIKPDLTRNVQFDLQRNIGSIVLRTRPPGATVFLNGKVRGVTLKSEMTPLISEPFRIDGLAAGVYSLRLEHPQSEKVGPQRLVLQKGQVRDLGTIELPALWLPTHVLKLKDRPERRGRLVSRDARGNIQWEDNASVRVTYRQEEIEYVHKIE